ncbi:unnamed protein product [Hydatigera taeniaeformis]|uniref:Uncharacterized protein n=1 Tax=Hydatigena taeniaeformis TaxID=6205 RepID=A0A3P7FCP6_HYDTA|nr:unnamed protein product [Hydatigera taeniaeformis]
MCLVLRNYSRCSRFYPYALHSSSSYSSSAGAGAAAASIAFHSLHAICHLRNQPTHNSTFSTSAVARFARTCGITEPPIDAHRPRCLGPTYVPTLHGSMIRLIFLYVPLPAMMWLGVYVQSPTPSHHSYACNSSGCAGCRFRRHIVTIKATSNVEGGEDGGSA